MIPKQVDDYMREALAEAIGILFPTFASDRDIISRHNWRTKKDLGEINGRVVCWRGWSANLGKVARGYRTVYCDYVSNELPVSTRVRLFGEEFCAAIDDLASFVVFFAASFSKSHRPHIVESGFVPRVIGPNLHACVVVDPADFLASPSMYWAAFIARLANFQKSILSAGSQTFPSQVGTDQVSRDKDTVMSIWKEGEWDDTYGLLDLE